MRCRKQDCLSCPYPDCINDYVPPERKANPEIVRKAVQRKSAMRKERVSSGLCTECGKYPLRQAQSISKAVVCIETGEVFLSQKSAESKVGKCYRHICDCCKGKKQTCGGYHWRYATREEAERALKGDEGK